MIKEHEMAHGDLQKSCEEMRKELFNLKMRSSLLDRVRMALRLEN